MGLVLNVLAIVGIKPDKEKGGFFGLGPLKRARGEGSI